MCSFIVNSIQKAIFWRLQIDQIVETQCRVSPLLFVVMALAAQFCISMSFSACDGPLSIHLLVFYMFCSCQSKLLAWGDDLLKKEDLLNHEIFVYFEFILHLSYQDSKSSTVPLFYAALPISPASLKLNQECNV